VITEKDNNSMAWSGKIIIQRRVKKRKRGKIPQSFIQVRLNGLSNS
jgi:hypothetical protein